MRAKLKDKPMPKILLVDDEPDIIEIIQYHLEKEGYLVKSAINGLECLTVAKSFVPDLILLDVMMPEMDGIEACVELRKENDLKGTIIAFLTARSEDYSQVAGLDSGADDYIAKPIKPHLFNPNYVFFEKVFNIYFNYSFNFSFTCFEIWCKITIAYKRMN